MLTKDEAHRIEQWIAVARSWGESSQGLAGASTEFSAISRELADQLDAGSDPFLYSTRKDLGRDLRRLADLIEAQVWIMRDDYLATAARLDELESVM